LSSFFVECVLGTSFSERECCARTSFCSDSVVVIMFKFLEAVLIKEHGVQQDKNVCRREKTINQS